MHAGTASYTLYVTCYSQGSRDSYYNNITTKIINLPVHVCVHVVHEMGDWSWDLL